MNRMLLTIYAAAIVAFGWMDAIAAAGIKYIYSIEKSSIYSLIYIYICG